MKVKELPKAMLEAAKKLGKVIANADAATLFKFGITAGITVATIIFVIKFLKDKKASYTDENNKTLVDEALEINYHDIRNQRKLHPMMNRVVDELEDELKPRMKKSSKRAREAQEEMEKIRRDVAKRKLKKEYDDFIAESKYEDRMLKAGFEYDTVPDYDSLAKLWNK